MTDKRRNLFVLLLVGALLIGSAIVIATKPTRLGLDLKGGVQLVYEAKATEFSKVTPESIDRAIEIMRKRVDALGVSEPEIQNQGNGQILVSLPEAKDPDQAIRTVGTTAQLFFYDWEANVLAKDCKPAPTDFQTTGGPNAGTADALAYYDAVARARRCPPITTGIQASGGEKFYLVNDKKRTVDAGPETSESDLRGTSAFSAPANRGDRIVKVNRGTILVQQEETSDAKGNGTGTRPNNWFVLRDNFALRGTDIKNPEQSFDNGPGGGNAAIVTFDFTDKGRDKWQDVTREISQRGQTFAATADGQPVSGDSANQHFAIVLDNQLVSVPQIDFDDNPDGIDGSNGSQITGGFTIKSAQGLANQLKYGALPINLDLISNSQVSATLGQEALDEALLAAAVGFALTAVFLLAFYRVLGLLAVGALLVYGVYFYALIKLIPVTLTLPGMAGLILTIGVCADANIVIFERVKEEITKGRSIPNAIGLGYKKGLSTIIDANVVTLLTAFVLFILATAGVKGFALTLGLGVLVTLFSAVLATSAFLNVTGSTALRNPRLVGARTHGNKRRFDFNGATRIMFTVSGIILLVGAISISTKGINFGIDFESGTRIEAAVNRPIDEGKVRDILAGEDLGSAELQVVKGSALGPNAVQVSTGDISPGQVAQFRDALGREFGGIRGQPQVTSIGPTFGNAIATSAVRAIIISLLLIAVYIAIRFEWKYAATTAISLMHDLLIVAGLYSLTGREVTSSTVAALLTVLGFSLYDTIIVNDRLRENMPRMPRATFSQISNRSMNEVVVRSISTVLCASLPILALLIFGGDTLKDFAFALLVGTVSGAYSSIFISSPVLTQWKEREPVYKRRREQIIAQLGHVPPFADEKLDVDTDRGPSRPGRRLTAPENPERQVSQREFDEMVRDLHADDPGSAPARPGGRTAGATAARPQTRAERLAARQEAQRRTADGDGDGAPAAPAPPADPAADASPEDLVLKDDKSKPKPRKPNQRHGRNR